MNCYLLIFNSIHILIATGWNVVCGVLRRLWSSGAELRTSELIVEEGGAPSIITTGHRCSASGLLLMLRSNRFLRVKSKNKQKNDDKETVRGRLGSLDANKVRR